MDIFLIDVNCAKNIEPSLLKNFQHKDFSNEAKKFTHSLSYLMTDRILKEFYKIKDRELEFIDNKPFLKNKQKYFSISHSGKYIALGFSDAVCGIDIEKITERDFISIAKRMNFKSKTLEEFYQDWTKYEAEYKLGKEYNSLRNYTIDGYELCAVSESESENFQIYIQNGDNFSNAKN